VALFVGVFQNKTGDGEKLQDFIRRVQKAGQKARANDEQIRNTIMEGFLSHIQLSVMNHDIESGAVGLASIKVGSSGRIFPTGCGSTS